MPSRPELVRRLPRCIVGLAMFGAGIAAIVRADLGLAPWDVFHQGVSELTGISLGLVIVLTGVALLLLWIPLRQRAGIGTVLNARRIGVVVDLVLAVVPETDAAALRWSISPAASRWSPWAPVSTSAAASAPALGTA